MNDFKDTCKYAKPNNTITLLTVIRNLKTCVSDPSIQHTRRMAFDNIFWVNTVKKTIAIKLCSIDNDMITRRTCARPSWLDITKDMDWWVFFRVVLI